MPAKARAARTHLLRAATAGIVAVAASVVASLSGQLRSRPGDPATVSERSVALAAAAVLLLGGALAARALARALRSTMRAREVEARGVPLARLVEVTGYVLVVLWTLGALGVGIQALLLGGALTGVALGIAAQQTLENVFAGIVLMLVRPFKLGERALVKSSLGEYEGLVTDISLFYVCIATDQGEVRLPNAVALASAVGPGARGKRQQDADTPEERTRSTRSKRRSG